MALCFTTITAQGSWAGVLMRRSFPKIAVVSHVLFVQAKVWHVVSTRVGGIGLVPWHKSANLINLS